MLNAMLKQYSWDDLMCPCKSAQPISDAQFVALMAPTNSDTSINDVPLTAMPMRDPGFPVDAE